MKDLSQTQGIALVCLGVVVLTVLLIGCQRGANPAPPEVTHPGQTQGYTDRLGNYEPLSANPRYSIRPPRGYSRSLIDDTTGSNAKTMIVWASAPRGDGPEHRILVTIGKERPGGRKITDYEPFADSYLRGREQRLGQVQRQPSESLDINGIAFRKVRWAARERGMTGVLFYATVGATDVIIDSEDVEHYQRDTLGIAEAVAVSFRAEGG